MSETDAIDLADRTQKADWAWADNAPNHAPLTTVLRRRWRTLIVVSTLAAALGVGAALTYVHPLYEVEATVHVAPYVRPILFKDYDTDISRQYAQFLATVSMNILNAEVVGETLESPAVRSLPLVLAWQDPFREIVSNIEVKRVGVTELLSVAMRGENPQDMAVIINNLVATYLRHREEQRRKWDDKIVDSLQREAQGLKTKLKSRQEQMRQAATQYGLTVGENAPDSVLEALVADLQQLLTEAKRDHARAAARALALDDQDGIEAVISADPAAFESYLAQDPQIQTLENELRSVELSALSDRRKGRGPNHPDVQSRPAQIADLRTRLEARTGELGEVYAASVVRRRRFRLLDAEATARFLEDEATKAQKRLAEERASVSGQRFAFDDLAHERERLEADLNQVRQKVWNIELERNRTARISVASHARVPEWPNIDKRPKYGAVALIFSLMLGVGAAMLRHSLDTKFRSPVDVTGRLGVRVLGTIQRVPGIATLEAFDDVRVVEPIRGISTALLASADSRPCHIRLITSPTPQSGKSSMALNLARSLAATGRRVLFVDADNHGQGVTSRLGLSGRPGVKELLEGLCSAEDIVCPMDPGHLHVLPAGHCSHAFGDLLAARSAQEILRAVFAKYDEVIVDSGPVLAGSNTAILATLVDEIILVLRAGRSKTDEARAAQEQLAGVGGRVVGVILNGVDKRTARQSYSYGYAYASQSGDGTA